VFDAGLSDGDAYIAMELLKGVDLRQLRVEGWQPTPAQAAQIVLAVAEALAYAHAHGVVHRDIKPANIFMAGRTQPRVLDFGIARVTQGPDAPAEKEFSGGSPYYMAPEQVLQQPVDARSDVFSLGVVLYELLTSVRPFRGESLEQIHRAVLEQRPPLASELAPTVPKALAKIAARAMATDREGRYPSAAAMARELRAGWHGAGPRAVRRHRRGRQRRRSLAGAAWRRRGRRWRGRLAGVVARARLRQPVPPAGARQGCCRSTSPRQRKSGRRHRRRQRAADATPLPGAATVTCVTAT
jgi:serine/threonine protein kinase